MEFLTAGVNHTTADVALREQLSLSGSALERALRSLRDVPGVAEAALLSTCNRTEIYCLVSAGAADIDLAGWLAAEHRMDATRVRDVVYQYRDEDALRHLMRVAGGLDSLVLGEPQILGQLREAYARAHEAGALGNGLSRLFQQAFSVAKRVRTETDIGANPVSVAYAAVSFARHIFADLSRSRALLIGAGEMIELVARHLHDQQVADITVANRSLARAQVLAESVNGRAVTLEELPVALEQADILITCTASPVPVLGKGVVERALKKRRHRPMFMVDIAVPRDIEPEVGELNDVYLFTVDDLHEAIEENVRQRQEAAAAAERLIEEALRQHVRETRELDAVDTLRAYRAQVQALANAELERALRQLTPDQDAAEVLRRFQHNLVNKLLHAPSVQLRRLAAEQREDALAVVREVLLAAESASTGNDEAAPASKSDEQS
ncbi:MAG: glutamyl-tRNA reductase [Alcanivoracaceae bacterium]